MGEVITITIPGKPFAWRRARSNGRVRFKDKATEAHVATLQAIAVPHFPEPLTGPVKLSVFCTFEIPKSWSKKKAAAHIHRMHCQKPDADNLAKQIGDGLNRIAWADDSQVAEIHVRKVWGSASKTVIHIEQMGEMP